MIRLGAISMLGLLAACAGSPAPSESPAPAAPKRYWLTPYQTATLCPTPPRLGRDTPGCSSLFGGDSFSVLQTIPAGYPDFRSLVKIRTESGKEGFIAAYELDSADDEAAHARAMAAKEGVRKKQAAAKAECDRRGGVRVGMTQQEVYASCWGKPERVNTTTTGGGSHHQLVYSGYNYVYIRNGLVSSIQTSSR